MSASFNWLKTCPAAWAISVCMASSFSSFLPSVCGLYRTIAPAAADKGPTLRRRETASSGRWEWRGFPGGCSKPPRRPAGHVDVSPLHPLVAAVGRVFRRFQMGVHAQPFAGAVEVFVELQARRQRFGIIAEPALEIGIAGDSFFPRRKGLFPGLVVREQAGEIPSIGGFDFAARGSCLMEDMKVWSCIVCWIGERNVGVRCLLSVRLTMSAPV